jgi:hypothetical protein
MVMKSKAARRADEPGCFLDADALQPKSRSYWPGILNGDAGLAVTTGGSDLIGNVIRTAGNLPIQHSVYA